MEKVTHYKIHEAALILRVKEPTIRSWISQGRIPVIRMGGRVFIKDQTIEAILNEGVPAVEH